jgi:hypothetical protein
LVPERYAHPHSSESADAAALAAKHWQRKEIALLDIAQALAIAVVIAAVSIKATGVDQSRDAEQVCLFDFRQSVRADHDPDGDADDGVPSVDGAHPGFGRTRGLPALHFFLCDRLARGPVAGAVKVPVLFGFCLVMAVANLAFTLIVGRLLKLNLEELLLAVNATLGGPASAGAMAISKGWSSLVLPAIPCGSVGIYYRDLCRDSGDGDPDEVVAAVEIYKSRECGVIVGEGRIARNGQST